MGKLVRDLIPDIIRAENREPIIKRLVGDELRIALVKKLNEEVREYIDSGEEEELADILEVIDGLFNLGFHDKEVVYSLKEEKRKSNGAFSEGIFLIGCK